MQRLPMITDQDAIKVPQADDLADLREVTADMASVFCIRTSTFFSLRIGHNFRVKYRKRVLWPNRKTGSEHARKVADADLYRHLDNYRLWVGTNGIAVSDPDGQRVLECYPYKQFRALLAGPSTENWVIVIVEDSDGLEHKLVWQTFHQRDALKKAIIHARAQFDA